MAHTSSAAVLLLAAAIGVAFAALPLPKYIKACSRNDPQLNDCIMKHGVEAIPSIINGDPKYRVPALDPLVITEMAIADRGLNLTMKDVHLKGLTAAELRAARANLDQKNFEWDLFIPRLEIDFTYVVAGRVLVLPISGSGPGNFTLFDVPVSMNFEFELQKKEDGQEYMVPTKTKTTFNSSLALIRLHNLFNGDKFLGDNTNKFLNENWREAMSDVGPVIADGITEVVRRLIANIASFVPYDSIFPK